MKIPIFVLFFSVVVNGAIPKKTIKAAVSDVDKISTAQDIGKLIRLACSESSQVKSLVQALKGATGQGLNCLYNNAISTINTFKGVSKIDYFSMLTKIQNNVASRCAQSIAGFAPALPVITQFLGSSPSNLIMNFDDMPTSVKNILNSISDLSSQVQENPDFVNTDAYKTSAKKITAAIRDLPQADAQKIANLYPETKSFLIKGKKNYKPLQNYLNLMDKNINGNLNKKQKKNIKKLAKKLLNLFIQIAIGRLRSTVNGLETAEISYDIKTDAAVNSAIRVLAPFLAEKINSFTDNPKFVPALVKLSKQADKFAKMNPNLVKVLSNGAQNKLDTSAFKIPWEIIS